MFDLRDLCGSRFKFNQLADFMVGSRNPILVGDNATIVILIMTDKDFTGRRSIFADDNRETSLSGKAAPAAIASSVLGKRI